MRASIPDFPGTEGNNSRKCGNNSCIPDHFHVGERGVIISTIWTAKNKEDGFQVVLHSNQNRRGFLAVLEGGPIFCVGET